MENDKFKHVGAEVTEQILINIFFDYLKDKIKDIPKKIEKLLSSTKVK